MEWFSKREVIVWTTAVAIVAIGMIEMGRRPPDENPLLRPIGAWTPSEFRRVFFDPDFHWCGGLHGHVPGRGPRDHCKGYVGGIFRAMRKRPRSPALDAVLIAEIRHERDPRAVAWAAETAGMWQLTSAIDAISERLDGHVESWDTDGREALACESWALARLGATSALPLLRAHEDDPNVFTKDAIAVLEGRLDAKYLTPFHGR